MCMDYKLELVKLLVKETKLPLTEVTNLISTPPDPKLGDYAFPCFKLGKNPKEEAEKLKKKIKLPLFVSKAEASGPYLNFFLNPQNLTETTLQAIFQEKEKYGRQNIGRNKTLVIDFSSPNIAKPFGIGHLRSTVIGHSLSGIYSFLGYKVIGVNHLGDWGTQFGKLIVAYQKWGKEKELQHDPIPYLLQLYVKFHKEAEDHPELEDQARTEFKHLEEGNPKSLKLWEKFRQLSLTEFERIYKILNVNFDSYHGEAFYNDKIDETITKISQKIPTTISEGDLIIDLKAYNLPPVLLRKSNESTTYHTRDLAAALYRLNTYKPEKIMYVVGSEQKLHFQQLFKVLELYGISKEKLVHIDFGLFHFPEGKMSTRKGQVIFLEEVLDKAIHLVEKIIEEKNPTLKNKEEVAKMIGVGAIIFSDLSNDRIRNIDFNWEKMLSFEGETAPYLQYTHARACSILKKAKKEKVTAYASAKFSLLLQLEEQIIVSALAQFPEILRSVIKDNKPHHLAGYLISLAQAFNEFYHKLPVISADKELMKARLALVSSTRQVLQIGLNLLGIRAPEEM